MDYLFDTNHASKILEGNESLSLRVYALKNSGSRFGISVSILGELFFAVYASKRKEENLRQLKLLLEDVIIWDYDITVAKEFGKIQAEQKAKGKPIPSIDAQIAAVARIHNVTVLTIDQHFNLVDGLNRKLVVILSILEVIMKLKLVYEKKYQASQNNRQYK